MNEMMAPAGYDAALAVKPTGLLSLQKQILQRAIAGAALPDLLTALAEAATTLGGPAAIFLTDRPGVRLRFAAGAGLPDSSIQAMDGLSISSPLSGMAAFTGEQVLVPDVTKSPLWTPVQAEAAAQGIRACWSTPIQSFGGRIVGALTLYHAAPRSPEPADLDAIELLAHTTALLMDRYRAEEERQDGERLLSTVIDHLPVGVGVIGLEGQIVRANAAMRRFITHSVPSVNADIASQWRADDADGRPIHPRDYPAARALRGEIVVPGTDFQFRRSSTEEVWARVMSVPLRSRDGAITGAVTTIIDIDVEKRAEQDLRAALDEARRNALLAHEMGHRVMNSFQLLYGLLSTHTRSLDNGQARAVVEQALERIQSMAVVHRRLFEATRNDLGPLDLGPYLRTIINDLLSALASSDRCRASISIPDGFQLDAGRASAIGLLTTELLLNALKHAFPEGRQGRLSVMLEADGREYRLTLSDDGVGLPPDHQRRTSGGMGMKLIRGLTGQLRGQLHTEDAQPGTRFILTFPI